ncbi:MAG: RuvB-like domain-containing protein [Desulfurococcales archaeon]|nr:RuvB-like domain-containing protein [Desulfurococcales archaeon]
MEEVKIPLGRARVPSLHSHITGLGLDRNGKALKVAGGLVGQEEAREAAGIIIDMIRKGKLGGKGILIAGPPGTGKTAIAIAIARELSSDTPFVALNASEVYSLEKKKSEVLMQAVRKAIGVRVRERKRVYEGVVTEIRYLRKRSRLYPYPIIAGAEIALEAMEDSRRFTVGPEIAEQLYRLNVRRGDVIEIDADEGIVRKLGRAKGYESRVFDIGGDVLVDKPSGEVEKVKEVTRIFTLHDIDVSLALQRAAFTSLFGVLTAEREISDEVRRKTDEVVKKIIDEGRAEIVPGVLFIDDAHLLDLESYSFITKAMESDFSPIIILATNRGVTRIRGADVESPHGMPRDLLDRLLIITTRPYTREEIREIIRIRADEEEVPLVDDALERLADIGVENSLRYAIQLLEPSRIIAERRGRLKVEPEDVEAAARLFSDVKRSVESIERYKDLMLT